MCMFHTSIKYILLHTLHVCVGTRMFGCLALVNGNDFTGVTFTSLQYLGVHRNQFFKFWPEPDPTGTGKKFRPEVPAGTGTNLLSHI